MSALCCLLRCSKKQKELDGKNNNFNTVRGGWDLFTGIESVWNEVMSVRGKLIANVLSSVTGLSP